MSTVADTGGGFITGVDPRQAPPTVADTQPQHNQTGQPPVQIVMNGATGSTAQPQGTFYSEEQVAQMRAETDARLAAMDEELRTLREDREQREAAARAEQERLAAEARTREEEAMDVRQLLERRDQEWQQRWEQLQQERERDQAIFAKEREWQALQDWKRDRVAQEAPYILPELQDLISGNDTAEIDASIEMMKARTQQILANVQEAVTSTRPPLRGASLTGQPSMGGPMEQQMSTEQISEDDIRKMDNKTYGQYRDRLMRVATRSGQAPPV
jgi:hypothetical protein